MDTPATGTALLLLVAFVLPGFITLVVRETTYVVRNASTAFERLLLSLSYSVRIYGILFVAAAIFGFHTQDISEFAHGKRGLWLYILVGGLALVVLPVAISECGRRWKKSKTWRAWVLHAVGISEGHSTPSGWDHFFGSDQPALVRLTLDDGRVVGGFFGSGSLAAYSEESGDLFLEERWTLDKDDWFVAPADSSLGLWIPHDRIVSVELYAPPIAPDTPTSETSIVSRGLAGQ